MTNPLISIIVPIYNVEQFLRKCIDSLIYQDYENIEIILVNDGSTDNCPKIIDEYSKKSNKIKVIHKKNGGLSDARNAGINIAKGDFITFVDSDDWVEKNYCSVLYKILNETKASIASCGIKAHGMTIANYNIEEFFFTLGNKIEVFNNIEALEKIRLNACAKLYKRELFEKILFPVGRIHEDEFIIYKLIYMAGRIASTKQKLYNRRMRAGSITRSNFNEKRLDIIDALKERANFYEQNGLNNLRIKTLASIVGICCRLKIEASKYNVEKSIILKLDMELNDALKILDNTKKLPFYIKMKIFLYKFFPNFAIFISRVRDIIFVKRNKN
ncbi:MAG: glycosyltransferase [Candidatus Goldbacteria bacterium]|nr:glycosyltransferase [Candidatus Goldiibacteriota bacterium]